MYSLSLLWKQLSWGCLIHRNRYRPFEKQFNFVIYYSPTYKLYFLQPESKYEKKTHYGVDHGLNINVMI